MATELLATYLNDHLATATAARELARRSATANRGGEHGAFLERVAGELDEQLAALGATMDALGCRRTGSSRRQPGRPRRRGA